MTRLDARHRTVLSAALLAALSAVSGSSLAQMRAPTIPKPKPQVEQVRGPLTPLIGAPDAPVTIVNFSDYYCPYCRTLTGTLGELLEKYPGRVRIVYRHYAVATPDSPLLAEASLCAADQDRFQEYNELIFATRGVGPDSLPGLAESLQLDLGTFKECLSSRRHERRVQEDIKEGDRLGIQVTPTFFVNGQRVAGAASLEALSARVEQLLR